MKSREGNAVAGLFWGVLFSLPVWAAVIGLVLYFTSN